MPVSLERFTKLLQQRMGLDADSIGEAAVERAVRERSERCACAGPDQYWERLCTSDAEVQELIEAVVVPETWFFRDREAFAALVRTTLGTWIPHRPGAVLRMLSLPCATGEEPYSISMALIEAGLLPKQFRIDAVDISQRALAAAQRGVYGKNSFRGNDISFRDRFFEAEGRGFRPLAEVREPVTFRHANLFADGAFTESHVYDAIFCRNVLIYFNDSDRARAVRLLERLLAPHGMLFVGPSESALLLDHGFVSARIPHAFAFTRPGTRASASDRAAVSPKPVPASIRATSREGLEVSRPRSRYVPAKAPAPAHTSEIGGQSKPVIQTNWVEQAQRLADAGNLVDAIAICEQNLKTSGASAQGFYLLGLLHDAGGRVPQAIEHYRKALYLDPQHAEALLHLGTALMSHGDEAGAKRIFERAKRASAVSRE